jgi:hypothetical protein
MLAAKQAAENGSKGFHFSSAASRCQYNKVIGLIDSQSEFFFEVIAGCDRCQV